MVDRYSIHEIIAACMLCGGHRVDTQQGGREGGRKEGGRKEGREANVLSGKLGGH